MDFDVVLKKRRCIRRYSIEKVSFSKLIDVCEASRFTPMAGNIFTMRLIIVSDKEKKQHLAEAALNQNFIVQAPYVIVVCSDLSQLERGYGTRAEMYGRQQAGAAIENMLLKAADLGLATCWVGAFDENAVKRVLQIPEAIQVEALLPIANPSGRTEAKKKPDLKLIVHFEKWGQKTTRVKKVPD